MLNVILIGYGYWGKNIARVLDEDYRCNLLVIIDKDKNRRIEASMKYPKSKVSGNFIDIIHKKNIHAVFIATPVSSHYEIVRLILSKGIPVFVEKVLSTELHQIRELSRLSSKNMTTLDVDYTFLNNSIVNYIKTMLQNDEFGRLNYLTFKRTGLGPIREDVNVLYDLVPHDVSMLIYWLGLPEWVIGNYRFALSNDRADSIFVQIGYADGLIASIVASWSSPLKQRLIEVVGEKKMCIFDDTKTDKFKIVATKSNYHSMAKDFASFQLSLKSGDIIIPNIYYPEPLKEKINTFLNNVTKSKFDEESLKTIWANSLVIDAIRQSAEQKGEKILINNEI